MIPKIGTRKAQASLMKSRVVRRLRTRAVSIFPAATSEVDLI